MFFDLSDKQSLTTKVYNHIRNGILDGSYKDGDFLVETRLAEELEVSHQYIHSGAGHDAQFCSYVIPTTMIFVQSKDGLSHCEPEFSSVKHCTEGASVMLNAVLKADQD